MYAVDYRIAGVWYRSEFAYPSIAKAERQIKRLLEWAEDAFLFYHSGPIDGTVTYLDTEANV